MNKEQKQYYSLSFIAMDKKKRQMQIELNKLSLNLLY